MIKLIDFGKGGGGANDLSDRTDSAYPDRPEMDDPVDDILKEFALFFIGTV